MYLIKTTILIIFISLHASITLRAQQLSATTTEPFNGLNNGRIVKTPEGFLAFQLVNLNDAVNATTPMKIKFGIKLIAYGPDMKSTNESWFENGEKKFGPFAPSFHVIKDKFYLITSTMPVEDEGSLVYMASEIDLTTLEHKNQVELFHTGEKKFPKLYPFMSHANIRVENSPDGEKTVATFTSGTDAEYFVSVFGKDMKPLWKKKEKSGTKDRMEIHSVAVSNSGTAYLTYQNWLEPDKQKLIISEESNRSELDVVTEGAKPMLSIVLPSSTGNFIHVVGTYKTETRNLTGLYHQKLSLDGRKVNSTTLHAFDHELIRRLAMHSWGNSRGKDYGAHHLPMRAVLTDGDNIAMMGEYRRIIEGSKRNYEDVGDIVAAIIGNDKATIRLFPKSRVNTISQLGDSYYAVASPDKITVFYNDYTKNAVNDIAHKVSSASDPSIMVFVSATMDKAGNFQRSVLLDLTREDYLLLPATGSYFNGLLIFYGIEIKSASKVLNKAIIAQVPMK